jgi:predicted  nucleic acid-binding Zn-ribbon protein
LLVVQADDTVADQLRHRLGALPERAELDATIARIRALETETDAVTERRGVIARDLKRLEDEVAAIEAHMKATDAKLYGGAVNAARELQALQDELKSLKRRQNSLEDDELELMEQAEPMDADLARLADEHQAADDEATRLTAAVAEAEAGIAAELTAVEAARAAAIEDVAPELLAEYERLRGQLGGIAVARLEAKTCGGCHLGLSAVEVDRIRKTPAGELVHCEECGRILVH